MSVLTYFTLRQKLCVCLAVTVTVLHHVRLTNILNMCLVCHGMDVSANRLNWLTYLSFLSRKYHNDFPSAESSWFRLGGKRGLPPCETKNCPPTPINFSSQTSSHSRDILYFRHSEQSDILLTFLVKEQRLQH